AIETLAGWMGRSPSALVELSGRKGEIAPGRDADLVVFDPDARASVDPSALHHKHRATPYEGRILEGQVEATFLRGTPVYRSGAFFGTPRGRAIRAEGPMR